jgi:hypothetical protein
MKNYKMKFLIALPLLLLLACSKKDAIVANDVRLHFVNTFKNTPIVLGDASSGLATINTSKEGQQHGFTEIKYVVSNIRLVKIDGTEIPYYINDLDKGAAVINHAKPETNEFVLYDIPSGTYKQLKFGLGVKSELNTIDQVRFPKFYAAAGANDTEMMWEWGTGYRFAKLEGFYDVDHKKLSIHTGSTIEGEEGAYTQGVDAYRDIELDLPVAAVVGNAAPIITIKADFDKLLSGNIHTIKLSSGTGMDDNATPNRHTSVQMMQFVENMGGNGTTDKMGMFSVTTVEQ